MLITKKFGQSVRVARKEANLTQEEFADLAGINRSHMGQIERGYKSPSLATIDLIAKALNCSVVQLLH